jgi:bla regulator protein blaR1
MAGLWSALISGGLVSVVAGGIIWFAFNSLRLPSVTLWRVARLACLLPLIAAPVIYLVPESPVLAGDQFVAWHSELPASQVLPAADSAPDAHSRLSISSVWIAWLYVAGLMLSLAQALIRHLRRSRMIRSCRAPKGHEGQMLAAAGSPMPAGMPPILIHSSLPSPILTGWNSRIILPAAIFSDPLALTFALAHEQAHARRGDERDRLVGTALSTLLWFHLPLRWIEQELSTAREIACDAETLAGHKRSARPAYAATLINSMRIAAPTASAFGPQNRKHIHMRITSILEGYSPASRRSVALAAGTTLAIIFPLAAVQAAWIDRQDAPVIVQQVEPVFVSTISEPEPDDMAFGDLAFGTTADPGSSMAPEPLQEPDDMSFAPASSPAPFVRRPVDGGRISSRFGSRPSQPAGAPPMHTGTDIAAPLGTPIVAPASGRVVHADFGFADSEAWGNTIAIDHGNGWQTVYAHMQGFDVSLGDHVNPGQQIGRVGSTGNSTGPHVHVEVRYNGERIDPAPHVPGLE